MNQQLSTIPAAALAKLRAKAALEQSIEVWRPQPGDTVDGVLVGSRMASGPFGDQRQALIETDRGIVAVWLTTWLLNELRANTVERGDLVSITFHGQDRGKSGKYFNRMTVTVLKADEPGAA